MTEAITTIYRCGVCRQEIRKAISGTWGSEATHYNDSEFCKRCTDSAPKARRIDQPPPMPWQSNAPSSDPLDPGPAKEIYTPIQKAPVDLTHVEIAGIRSCRKLPVIVKAVQIFEPFVVQTLEGTSYTAQAGDYLMIGVEGERYPCRKDIFEKTYEWIK